MPETPSASARSAKRISVSVIASRAPSTRAGRARGACARGAARLDPPGPARRRRGGGGADPLPVAGLAHGAGGARAVAVGRHGVGLDAAPGLDRGGAAPRELDEVP